MSKIGPITTARHVERAVGETLLKWIATYIHEMEDQLAAEGFEAAEGVVIQRGDIPVPASYTRLNTFEKMPEDVAPTLLVISPGTASTRAEGESYSARWRVVTGIIAATHGQEFVRDLSQYYAAAIRTLMIQKGDLDGFASGLEWDGEQYQDLGTMSDRSNAAARDQFVVEVEDVVLRRGGPAEPDVDENTPHPDDPLAFPVTVDINKED